MSTVATPAEIEIFLKAAEDRFAELGVPAETAQLVFAHHMAKTAVDLNIPLLTEKQAALRESPAVQEYVKKARVLIKRAAGPDAAYAPKNVGTPLAAYTPGKGKLMSPKPTPADKANFRANMPKPQPRGGTRGAAGTLLQGKVKAKNPAQLPAPPKEAQAHVRPWHRKKV